jgi:hypothetical protein
MKTRNHESRTSWGRLAHSLVLPVAIAVLTMCAASYAQSPSLVGSQNPSLIGSPGAAGWQTWSVTPISYTQPDLNDNGSPWWDLQWNAAGSYGASTTADKNPGFCITATGDCVGMASGAFAPGAIPFWAWTPYDPVADMGGTRDNTVYFHSTGGALVATLFLNATANPNEVNDFGWFSTNSTGTVVLARHKLFSGTGVTKDQIPTPTGTAITFTPTRYFGFYYSDVSEPACPDGTDTYLNGLSTPCVDPNAVLHGCYAYSTFLLNDQKCVNTTGGQGDHDFVVFSANAQTSSHPTYWVAGEDPADCATNDGDCNLTLVRVTAK